MSTFLKGLVLTLLLLAGSLQGQKRQTRFEKLRQRALLLAREGRITAAIPFFKKMATLQSYNERALFLLAQAYIYQEVRAPKTYRKDLIKAVRLLEQSIRMQRRYNDRSPALGIRYHALGMAHWYSGNPLKALTAFRHSYRADFERVDAVYNQFAILEELGRTSEARILFLKLQKIQENSDIDD